MVAACALLTHTAATGKAKAFATTFSAQKHQKMEPLLSGAVRGANQSWGLDC